MFYLNHSIYANNTATRSENMAWLQQSTHQETLGHVGNANILED